MGIKISKSISYRNNLESKKHLSQIQFNLIKILRRKGPLTRSALANHLKIPRSTVYDNLKRLQKKNLVIKFVCYEGKQGRPPVFWDLRFKRS